MIASELEQSLIVLQYSTARTQIRRREHVLEMCCVEESNVLRRREHVLEMCCVEESMC